MTTELVARSSPSARAAPPRSIRTSNIRRGPAPDISFTFLPIQLIRLLRAVIALLGIYATLLLGTPAHAAENRPAIYDTGYEIIPSLTTRSAYWTDNEHLLFFGTKSRRVTRPDVRKLYVWEWKSKSTRYYADASNLCFSDGYISYRLYVDKAARTEAVREGPLGSETQTVRALPPLGAVKSNLTCKTHLRAELIPTPPLHRLIAVLRPGDGYLDLGPSDITEKRIPVRNLVLYRPQGIRLPLPITWDEDISTSGVTYSAFRKAYVLKPRAPNNALDTSGAWPKGRPLIVYLLWADGRTETTTIPYVPAEFLTDPQPLRVGWLFGGGNFYKASGLYLFHSSVVSKIDTGLVKEIAVAPDGCRVAAAIQNDHLNPGTPTFLKILDFCLPRP